MRRPAAWCDVLPYNCFLCRFEGRPSLNTYIPLIEQRIGYCSESSERTERTIRDLIQFGLRAVEVFEQVSKYLEQALEL